MGRHRKTWTVEQKLEILEKYREKGAVKTSREYDVGVSSIYKWRDAYELKGEAGLLKGSKSPVTEKDLAFQKLQRENESLKLIIAEKELALRIKDELLKKTLLRKQIN